MVRWNERNDVKGVRSLYRAGLRRWLFGWRSRRGRRVYPRRGVRSGGFLGVAEVVFPGFGWRRSVMGGRGKRPRICGRWLDILLLGGEERTSPFSLAAVTNRRNRVIRRSVFLFFGDGRFRTVLL